jgi:hypothetical protein
MAKKQFKIGERAVGGIIAVEITGKVIQIKALDYYSKEEVSSGSGMSDERNVQWKLDSYLNDLTTSYYADKIMTWIKSKVKFDYTW